MSNADPRIPGLPGYPGARAVGADQAERESTLEREGVPVSTKRRQARHLNTSVVKVAGDPAQGGSGPTLVAEYSPRRIALWLFNNNVQAMAFSGSRTVAFSSDSSDAGFILLPNSFMEIDNCTDSVYACGNWGAGTGQLRVAELVE